MALDPDTCEALGEYLALWHGEREALGQETRLLFVWPDGRAIHPDTITALFHRHCASAGLPRIRLHDVRHSYASAALKAGISPEIISERLGHASVAFTLQTYTHLVPGMDRSAAEATAALILRGEAHAPSDGRILGRIEGESETKENWPGTKSQASGGSGGRI